MACSPTSIPISLVISLTILFLAMIRPSICDPNSSFSFPHFGGGYKNPNLAFYGDSKLVVNGGDGFGSIRLGASGRFVYREPMKLIEGTPQKSVSFSTHFSFSVPSSKGESTSSIDDEQYQGLTFLFLPSDFNLSTQIRRNGKDKILTVKFKTLLYYNGSDDDGLVRIHAGIEGVGLASKSNKGRNVSTVDLTQRRSGNKSFAWIDYEASSKRLEVRLSQSTGSKPVNPLFWYPVDLSKLWSNHKALMGFAGVNSSSSCTLHSWGFDQRHVPRSMHSQPLDPNKSSFDGRRHSKPMKIAEKKRDCFTKIMASMVFGVGCGALTAFMGLYLWSVFGNKRPVVPEESVEFEYKKFKVNDVDNKAVEDGPKSLS